MSHKRDVIVYTIIIIVPILLLAGFVLFTPPQQPVVVHSKSIKLLSQVNGSAQFPQISTMGDKVYVVWQYNNPANPNTTITFIENRINRLENLSNSNGTSSDPQIAASDSNVYVVWKDNSTGNDDIYFSKGTNNGSRFRDRDERNLSNNTGTSSDPQIAASDNNVYVVWKDNSTGNDDIYLRRLR